MSVLDKKLKRDLWAAKGILSAIIGILIVGVLCFVGMGSLYLNLEDSRSEYYSQCRMADFWLEAKKVPVSELERLEEIPGITEIHPRIVSEVTVDLPDVEKPLSGRVVSLPDSPQPVINNIVIRKGGYFTTNHRAEVILSDPFARARGLGPGDRLHVLLNNRRQELFVVGTAISSEYVYTLGPGGLVPEPENYAVLYIKHSYAEEVFDFEGAFNQIVGRLDPAVRDQPDHVFMELENRLEPYGVGVTTPLSQQSSNWFLRSEIDGQWVSAIIVPGMFLSVAALILNVLMLRVAEQQRTVIGTLKALSYSNAQLMWHFLKFGGTIGLVGGILGSIGGYLFAGWVTGSIYVEFYEFPRLINRPYPLVMLIGVLISVGFAVLGTVRGVSLVIRLKPAEAMRPKPPARGRRTLLELWPVIWRRLGFRWQMVLRSVFRHRVRTSVTVFAASIGAAMMIVTFFSRDSMIELIAFQFDKVLVSDFDVTFEDDRDFGVVYEARQLPGVDEVEPVFQVGCTFRNGHRKKQGAITGLMPDARMTVPRDADGNAVPVPQNGLLISRKLAADLGVELGDSVRIIPLKGRRSPIEIPITSITDSYLGIAAYADFYYLNHIVGEESAVSMLQMKVNPDRESVRQFYREVKQIPAVGGVAPIRENKAKLKTVLVDKMMALIVITILFAGLIFFGSILNASLISLAERQTEIATLRVLGYTPREIGGIFLRESLLLNGMGTLIGLPLGYGISRVIVLLYNTELFRLPFTVSPWSWAITIGLGAVFTLLAHALVQRSINRMQWMLSLNVKE